MVLRTYISFLLHVMCILAFLCCQWNGLTWSEGLSGRGDKREENSPEQWWICSVMLLSQQYILWFPKKEEVLSLWTLLKNQQTLLSSSLELFSFPSLPKALRMDSSGLAPLLLFLQIHRLLWTWMREASQEKRFAFHNFPRANLPYPRALLHSSNFPSASMGLFVSLALLFT